MANLAFSLERPAMRERFLPFIKKLINTESLRCLCGERADGCLDPRGCFGQKIIN
jgi:hypothetical protein